MKHSKIGTVLRGILLFTIFGCMLLSCNFSFKDEEEETPELPEGEIPILSKKFSFPVGAAVSRNSLNTTNPEHNLLQHFNVYVAENDMKPDGLQPTKGNFVWTNGDRLVDYAQKNQKKARGHVLIWHSQTPAWFFRGSGVEGRATKAELYANMENHIKTVMEHYKGKIDSWDVCNEVVGDDAQPRSNSSYYQIMQDSGSDDYEYVLKAFQWAREADPGSKLFLTDYGIERGGSGSKQDAFYRLVTWLKGQQAPIDGVGFQGHIRIEGTGVAEFRSAIDRFSALGLKVQITELDMSIFSNQEGQLTSKTDAEVKHLLLQQAYKYRDLFALFSEKAAQGKLDMVLLWGLSDGTSWLNTSPPGRTDYPLLFDRTYQPKPAFWILVDPSKVSG